MLEIGYSEDGRVQFEFRGLIVVGDRAGASVGLLFDAVGMLSDEERAQMADGQLEIPAIYVDGRLHRLSGF